MSNKTTKSEHEKKHQTESIKRLEKEVQPAMDTLISNDVNRKQFRRFLRQLNPKLEPLPFFHVVILAFTKQAAWNKEDNKYALQKAHKFYEEQKLGSLLSDDVHKKMSDTLRRLVYDEVIFRAVESEVRSILEAYYPSFLKSPFYDPVAINSSVSNKQESCFQDETFTISKVIKPTERTSHSFCYKSICIFMFINYEIIILYILLTRKFFMIRRKILYYCSKF